MDKIKTLKLLVSIFITFAFFYFFQKIVGFDKLLDFFRFLTFKQIFLAFILYIFSYVVRTVRWSYTLSIKDFFKLFKLTVYNTFFNIVLPFRTGEISFFYMLKKENIHIAESTMSFIITRFFDGISLLSLFFLAYFTYTNRFILGVISFILLPFSFLILLFLFKFIKHEKIKNYNQSMINFKSVFMVYFLSVLTLIFKFSAFYIILPKEANLDFLQSILASSLADLTTVLPVHGIAGIGTYETGYVGILIYLSVPKDTALLSAFLVHTFILTSSSFLAIFVYIFKMFKP